MPYSRNDGRRADCGRRCWPLAVFCLCAFGLSLAGCGGGSSSSSGTKNPVPSILSISPTGAPAGSRGLTLTVSGSKFVSGSVVRWGGSSRATKFVSSTRLTAAITPEDLASAGGKTVAVYNPAPGGGTSGSLAFTVDSVSPLSVMTRRLPDGVRSRTYSYALQASGGIPPYAWAVTSGSLPDGLSLDAAGEISGTAPDVAVDTASDFTLQVSDDSYRTQTQAQSVRILVRAASLGRNETCAAATPVSDGAIRASISPYGDVDVYAFQGTAGSQVTVETYASRLRLYEGSTTTDIFLDSFLEILDSGCAQLVYSDDILTGVVTDSQINYTLPYSGTYFIRVSDLRADGRPDFIYELHLSGAD